MRPWVWISTFANSPQLSLARIRHLRSWKSTELEQVFSLKTHFNCLNFCKIVVNLSYGSAVDLMALFVRFPNPLGPDIQIHFSWGIRPGSMAVRTWNNVMGGRNFWSLWASFGVPRDARNCFFFLSNSSDFLLVPVVEWRPAGRHCQNRRLTVSDGVWPNLYLHPNQRAGKATKKQIKSDTKEIFICKINKNQFRIIGNK